MLNPKTRLKMIWFVMKGPTADSKWKDKKYYFYFSFHWPAVGLQNKYTNHNQRKIKKKKDSSFFSSFFGSVHGCSTVGPRRKSNSIFLRQPWANMDGRWPRKAAHRWYERYPTSVSSVRRQRSSSVSFGLSSAGLSKFLSVTNNLDLLGSSRQIVCDLEFGKRNRLSLVIVHPRQRIPKEQRGLTSDYKRFPLPSSSSFQHKINSILFLFWYVGRKVEEDNNFTAYHLRIKKKLAKSAFSQINPQW